MHGAYHKVHCVCCVCCLCYGKVRTLGHRHCEKEGWSAVVCRRRFSYGCCEICQNRYQNRYRFCFPSLAADPSWSVGGGQ